MASFHATIRPATAAGLPIVSTAIPEVEVLGQCRIATDAGAFVCEVEAALADPGTNRAEERGNPA